MNKPTYINEIKLIINKLQNISDLYAFISKLCSIFKEKNIPQSLFQKIKLGRMLSNSFSEDSVISL